MANSGNPGEMQEPSVQSDRTCEESSQEMSEETDIDAKEQILGNDFALCRVPKSARYSWASMALEQMAQGGCIANVVLGAQIGHKMLWRDALVAVFIGNFVLALISMALGSIGCREGLTTAMLGRWLGLGVAGTGVLSAICACSLFGWFGMQAEIAGIGLESMVAGPAWAWTLVNGGLVTFIVAFGFRWMVGAAWITGPVFLVVVIWACVVAQQGSRESFRQHVPAASELSLWHSTSVVVGGWVVGSTVLSDFTRFAKSKRQVVSLVALPRTGAIAAYQIAGVLLAQACGTDDVVTIMHESVGLGAVIIVVGGEMVINCTNIYSATLAIVAFFDMCFGWQIPRPAATVVCGVIGSALGAFGILKGFIGFVSLLSVTFPPVAGLMCCEYLLVRAFCDALDNTRESGDMPSTAPGLIPASLVAWVVGTLLGHFVPKGVPYLYSLFGAAMLYYLASACGLLRSYGEVRCRAEKGGEVEPPAVIGLRV